MPFFGQSEEILVGVRLDGGGYGGGMVVVMRGRNGVSGAMVTARERRVWCAGGRWKIREGVMCLK